MVDISDLLVVKEASIFSFIHENIHTGLERNMFWYFTIEFEEFEIEGIQHNFQLVLQDLVDKPIQIIPENLKCNMADVQQLATQYVDLNVYEGPIFENDFRYRFKPKV